MDRVLLRVLTGRLVAVLGAALATVACTASGPKPAAVRQPHSTDGCGVLRIQQTLASSPSSERWRPALTSYLQAAAGHVTVDRVVLVRAPIPDAHAYRLPHGSRRVWLVYTTESGGPAPADVSPPPGVPGPPSFPAVLRAVHLVDDQTLRFAGNYSCGPP